MIILQLPPGTTACNSSSPAGSLSPSPGPPCSSPPPPPASGPSTTSRSPTSSACKSSVGKFFEWSQNPNSSTAQLHDEQRDPDDSAEDKLPHLCRLLAPILLWWECEIIITLTSIFLQPSYLSWLECWSSSVPYTTVRGMRWLCSDFLYTQISLLLQVISWADFLNKRSREVMPFLFIIFLTFFFLVAADVLDVE